MITLEQIEHLIKTDNPLEVYNELKDYDGEDLDLLYWKEKIKKYVPHAFDKEAYNEFYGTLPEQDVEPRFIRVMDRVYPRIKFARNFLFDYPSHKTLVDVGCATGENTLYFGTLDYEVSGINLSKESIVKANNKAKEMNINANFINSNFLDVKGKWDIVLFMEIFEHVPDPKQAIEKIWSFLNPKGLLFISTPKPNFWGVKGNDDKWKEDGPRGHLKLYSEEELRELLKDYNIIEFYEDSAELYNIVCQKLA